MSHNLDIVVLGRGACGKAIGFLLQENNADFTYKDKGEFLQSSPRVLFLAVPTQSIREALEKNKKFITPETILVNCAKGIEEETLLLPFQIVHEIFGECSYHSLIGPSFAEEIIGRYPTLVNLGSRNVQHAGRIKGLLQTSYFRIEKTKYYQSIELAAALKNIYAIVCGFADGLGFRMNTRAKLITIAAREFSVLASAMGFSYETLVLPGILGDLVLTCSSEESRNFTFGTLLAAMAPKEALEKFPKTIEGYYTSHSIQALARKHSAKLPLAILTHSIIEKGKDARSDFEIFVREL